MVFEVDLLKSLEINLDYILELIFENNKTRKDKATLVEDVRRLIRSSIGSRAKESLVVDFINQTDLDSINGLLNNPITQLSDCDFAKVRHTQSP